MPANPDFATTGNETDKIDVRLSYRMPEPEIDRLSNILKTFNEQFGNIAWTDEDRIRQLITQEIPAKVAADTAFKNAMKNTPQNARIKHDKALARVMSWETLAEQEP